ncbi:hypothetical protein TYRP_019620 [Tyrophagus putrescentiae]|nr:hypothetical protein TYRP_019620 [Tyrophagus putrescentiae]
MGRSSSAGADGGGAVVSGGKWSRSSASMSSTTTGSSSSNTAAGNSGSISRSSSSSMTTEALPNGLTAGPPGLAHLLYMLTLYRYVLLCFLFGLLSVILGVALLTMAVMMRSRTTSVHLLESVPLYMPAMILICNGASMVAFMHKQSRRFYLLKSVCGLFLLSALLLIIVCVTTSVIHLPRLHSHTECAYTGRLRACTCVQKVDSSETSIASKHFIMEDIASCELVHGTLYDSLRSGKWEEQDCLTANEDDDERNGGEGKGSSPEEAVSITPVPSKQFTFGSSSQHRLDNHQQHRQHYLTTFEEAFKNYYDSQHRLSSGAGDSQQNNSNHNNNHSNLLDNQDTAAPAHHYYTMPAKKSEHQRSKRRRTYIAQVEIPVQQAEDLHQQQQRQQQQAVFCINTDLNSMMMADVIDEPPCLLYQHSLQYHHGAPVNENMNQEQTTAGHHQQYMSEEEPFPAIEPPADYKNAITIEEIVPNHLTAESKTRTMEQLTSQLMQPYQIWMQQFIEQMNALNYPTAQVVEDDAARDKIMIAYPNVQSVQAVAGAGAGDGYATQGDFVDDEEDDAGDTSTSQDIADFELELDEEPIQFVEVDEEYKKPVEKPAVLVPVETIQPVDVQPKQQQQQLPPVVTSHNEVAKIVTPPKDHSQNQQQQPQQMYPIDLLKKNTELIWRAVKMNKASADYGFDGFRKGCFDDGDDSSSTSSTSSLTNGETTTNDSHDNSSDSGSSQSITAEYIKPPTPFTNNFLCQ